jgi:hypothetical protein
MARDAFAAEMRNGGPTEQPPSNDGLPASRRRRILTVGTPERQNPGEIARAQGHHGEIALGYVWQRTKERRDYSGPRSKYDELSMNRG